MIWASSSFGGSRGPLDPVPHGSRSTPCEPDRSKATPRYSSAVSAGFQLSHGWVSLAAPSGDGETILRGAFGSGVPLSSTHRNALRRPRSARFQSSVAHLPQTHPTLVVADRVQGCSGQLDVMMFCHSIVRGVLNVPSFFHLGPWDPGEGRT